MLHRNLNSSNALRKYAVARRELALSKRSGVTRWRHPDTVALHVMLRGLIRAGLDGIEVRCPNSSDRSSPYTDVGVREAAALVKHHDLIPNIGSDYHGTDSEKFRIGNARILEEALRQILCTPASFNHK